jgi:hypothetical protein
MTRTAIALLGTAFALGLSGTAYAQTSGSAMDPVTMTCADLTALGDDEMQGALDMVASHAAITGTTSTSAPATSTTTGSSSAETGAAGTDATAGAATGTTGTTDSTGSSGDTTTAGAATGTTDTTGSAGGDSSTMAAGSLDQMQIDSIKAACAESPERLVSDVYREAAGETQ